MYTKINKIFMQNKHLKIEMMMYNIFVKYKNNKYII